MIFINYQIYFNLSGPHTCAQYNECKIFPLAVIVKYPVQFRVPQFAGQIGPWTHTTLLQQQQQRCFNDDSQYLFIEAFT